MGLTLTAHRGNSFCINMEGKSVLDIGGGPCSLLLKCLNVEGKVIDPLIFPIWIYRRYEAAGIKWGIYPAEELKEDGYDEAWVYNVLQHVFDPKEVVIRVRRAAAIIRIFEWIDTPPNIGHLHTLKEEKLNYWLQGEGKTEVFKGQNGCFGKAYYGIFLGKGQV